MQINLQCQAARSMLAWRRWVRREEGITKSQLVRVMDTFIILNVVMVSLVPTYAKT